MTMRRSCEFIAAVALLAAVLSGAHAQQRPVSGSQLMFDPNGLHHGTENRTFAPPQPATIAGQRPASPKPSATSDQQAAAPKPAAVPASKRPAAPKPPQQAASNPLPARSASHTPREQQPPALGRVALPQGSLGFENETKMKAYDLSDGRRVPGYDNIQRNDSSYFGLSLRLPTDSSSFVRDHGAN